MNRRGRKNTAIAISCWESERNTNNFQKKWSNKSIWTVFRSLGGSAQTATTTKRRIHFYYSLWILRVSWLSCVDIFSFDCLQLFGWFGVCSCVLCFDLLSLSHSLMHVLSLALFVVFLSFGSFMFIEVVGSPSVSVCVWATKHNTQHNGLNQNKTQQ